MLLLATYYILKYSDLIMGFKHNLKFNFNLSQVVHTYRSLHYEIPLDGFPLSLYMYGKISIFQHYGITFEPDKINKSSDTVKFIC